ncbi:MAG: GIY-YIG nuclease family protein [Wolbachia sp.]
MYIGITSNLIKRIWEHKSKAISGFTSKYSSFHRSPDVIR